MTGRRPRTRIRALLVAGCTAATLAMSAVETRAGSTTGTMGDLVVPGGRSTLRLAGVPDDVPRGTLLPLLVRLLHADPPGSVPEQDARLARVRARVERMEKVEAALTTLEAGTPALRRLGKTGEETRVEDALATMGARLRDIDGRAVIEADPAPAAIEVRLGLADAGFDVAGAIEALNGGGAIRSAFESVTLPLPIPAAGWQAALAVHPLPPDKLFAAVVLDRTGALLLHGLLAMDGPTRTWAAAQPGLLRGLALSAPAVAAFGRSLHVEGDAISLPGGAAAAPVWEMLAREPVRRPERFVRALFTKDEGRFAYFFDAVAHMTPAQQGLVLGILPACGAADLQQAGQTYQAFLLSTGEWRPAGRPFLRPVFDAVTVLDTLDVLPDGRPAGPRWKQFWERAFDETSPKDDPASALDKLEMEGEVDPATLVRVVALARLAGQRGRLEQLRFVQRVFPSPAAASLQDVLVTARAFARFPALLLGLERLGVRDAGTYVAAARRALAIDEIGDGPRRYAALGQFQGALAVIDGAAAARYLDPSHALALTASLLAVPVSRRGYDGALAGWAATTLVPALRAPMGDAIGDPVPEQLILRAWSGPPPGNATPPLAWEGQQYVADPAAAEFERLRTLRARQGGVDIGPVLVLWQAAANVAAATSVESARHAVTEVERAAAAMPAVAPNASLRPGAPLAEEAAQVSAEIRRAPTHDLRRLARALSPIWQQVDRLLAQALLSLAYTPHLGDPDTAVLTGNDIALRHEFGSASAWRRPEEDPDVTGHRVRGSLLGLDLSLSRLALRRLASDSVPPPRVLNENVVQELRETLVLVRREPPSDADVREVAAAIARGRERVAAAGADATTISALLAEAGAGEWRKAAALWMAASEPLAIPGLFAQSELLAIGSGTLPAAFGTSASGTDGCWCLEAPRTRPWEDLAGRPGMPLVAAHFTDLGLSLAAQMHDLGVPANLYPSLLAFAAQDFIETAGPQHPEDWPAFAAAARLSRERVEDYVSGLAGRGPLRVVEKTTR